MFHNTRKPVTKVCLPFREQQPSKRANGIGMSQKGACRGPPKVLGGSAPVATGPKTGVQRLFAARGARRKHQVFSETSRVALRARSLDA